MLIFKNIKNGLFLKRVVFLAGPETGGEAQNKKPEVRSNIENAYEQSHEAKDKGIKMIRVGQQGLEELKALDRERKKQLAEDLAAVKEEGCTKYPKCQKFLQQNEAEFDWLYGRTWINDIGLDPDARWKTVAAMEVKLDYDSDKENERHG